MSEHVFLMESNGKCQLFNYKQVDKHIKEVPSEIHMHGAQPNQVNGRKKEVMYT